MNLAVGGLRSGSLIIGGLDPGQAAPALIAYVDPTRVVLVAAGTTTDVDPTRAVVIPSGSDSDVDPTQVVIIQ